MGYDEMEMGGIGEEDQLLEAVIRDLEKPTRIDKVLAGLFPEYSRSYLQSLIEDWRVSVNGRPVKASDKVSDGAMVSLLVPPPEDLEVIPEDIPLDILYEDEDVILVNKPKGMVVHPAAGNLTGTLVNALLYHCGGELSGIGGVRRPGIVHRIDKDTAGVLIACKTDLAHKSLSEQLAAHSVTRRYEAIVHGTFSQTEGTVDAPIGRHKTDRKRMTIREDGKRAVTHYEVLENLGGKYAHIACRLETGRTHQIRVHMTSISHPLVGDPIYGPGKKDQALLKGLTGSPEGQMLFAEVLGFIHPRSGEYIEVHAPLPAYFTELLTRLR